VHESVGVDGLGDGRKIPNISEKDCNLFSNSAKLRSDGVIDDPLDEFFGNKVSE